MEYLVHSQAKDTGLGELGHGLQHVVELPKGHRLDHPGPELHFDFDDVASVLVTSEYK